VKKYTKGVQMKLNEFLDKVFPILLKHDVDRIDKEVEEGKVSVYWVKDLLRIDIRFKSEEDFN
jgi:hypothetical protein